MALSTSEAEFSNLTPAGHSLLWVARMMKEMGFPVKIPLLLLTDSNNAMAWTLNALNNARTRHLDTRFKWITERVAEGDFRASTYRFCQDAC